MFCCRTHGQNYRFALYNSGLVMPRSQDPPPDPSSARCCRIRGVVAQVLMSSRDFSLASVSASAKPSLSTSLIVELD